MLNNKIKIYIGIFVLTISLGLSSAFASSITSLDRNEQSPWLVSVSAGAGWAEAGTRQTFYLAPNLLNTYDAKTSDGSQGALEIFAGLHKAICPSLQGQFGLAVGFINNVSLAGNVWDDGLVQFNNRSYQYKVKQTYASIKAKLVLDKGWSVLPWVGARAGLGINTAQNFRNSPVIVEALPNENFSNHTSQSFTYALSAGIQKELINHWQVGLSYEYSDLGKSQLGATLSQTLNSGLLQKHLYIHNILMNLTYMT